MGSGEVNSEAFPYIVFGVPIALVIFIAIFKHVVWRTPNIREVAKFFLEISIDVLTVGATILFAYYYKVTTPAGMFWLTIYLFFAMIVSLVIRSLNMEGKLSGYNYLWVILCPVMCVVAIFWLFILVC